QRAELVATRKELSDYAIALNVKRNPLRRSLHDVLGRVVALQHLKHAPVAGVHGVDLTPEQLADLLGEAERLGRAWGPITRGDGFLWRHLRDANTSTAQRQQIETHLRQTRQ